MHTLYYFLPFPIVLKIAEITVKRGASSPNKLHKRIIYGSFLHTILFTTPT